LGISLSIIEIEHIRKPNVRKENLEEAVLAKRGRHPGLVAIFSAMEPCASYQPWHNKQTGKTYLKPDNGKCLHYYFYLIDEELGLTYVRVPTWLPGRLQIYLTGTTGWQCSWRSGTFSMSCETTTNVNTPQTSCFVGRQIWPPFTRT
jgi:hypothetical protein